MLPSLEHFFRDKLAAAGYLVPCQRPEDLSFLLLVPIFGISSDIYGTWNQGIDGIARFPASKQGMPWEPGPVSMGVSMCHGLA